MKIFMIVLGTLCLSYSTFAQSPAVQSFIGQYKNQDATSISLSGIAIKLASNQSDKNRNFLSKIEGLNLLVLDETNQLPSKAEVGKLLKSLRSKQYEDLIQIREDGNQVQFLIREDNNKVTNVLMLVKGEQKFVLLDVYGSFRYEDLNDIDLDADPKQYFKRIPEKRSEIPRA